MSMLPERLTILLSRTALRTGYLRISFDALTWFIWRLKKDSPPTFSELPLMHWRDPNFLMPLWWTTWWLEGRIIRYEPNNRMLECSAVEAQRNLARMPRVTRSILSDLLGPSIAAFAGWTRALTKGMSMEGFPSRAPEDEYAQIFAVLFALAARGRETFRVRLAAWPLHLARLRHEFPAAFPDRDPVDPELREWPEWLNDAMNRAVFRDRSIVLTADECLETTPELGARTLERLDPFTRHRLERDLGPVVERLIEMERETPDANERPNGAA